MRSNRTTEEKIAYNSIEEYQKELVDWGKQWIRLYCERAVELSEEGEIALIKGKLIFKKELSALCEQPFTKEEIEQYESDTAKLLQSMKRIHEKSRAYIAAGEMISMEYLYRMFGFEEFEWYLFCMAFLVETDTQFERVFALLQDDFAKKAPTLSLCIRMYTLDEERQYQLLHRVMERWEFLSRFLEETQNKGQGREHRESVLSTALVLDERIVRFIYDMNSQDPLLQEFTNCYLPSDTKQPMLIRETEIENLKGMYDAAFGRGFLFLSGERNIGKKFLVRHFCKSTNQVLLMVDIPGFLEQQRSVEWLVKRLSREAILKGGACICLTDIGRESQEEEAEREETLFLERLIADFQKTDLIPILTSEHRWRESVKSGSWQCMELVMEPTELAERELLWKYFLEESFGEIKVDAARLAGTYKLPPGAIEKVVRETAMEVHLAKSEEELEKKLYQGCQRQLVHSLGKDAVQVPAQYTMEELVLPAAQKKMLKNACDMVEYHHQVFETWGFDQKMAYGKGVSMIFYGPPGTGKTMGAQAMANALHLELYRVDMASVLSKYVGESEKKLGNIFEQGQKSQSILFFDEADALFGKRSEVKDSQDKYANASTAFLLQKLEEYQGIIILATNLLQNFDTAFCRRFQFIIEFPFPDIPRREEIWRKVLPEKLPKESLDYEYLAENFVLSGSQIKNIAVAAAFLAAGEQQPLKMVHILRSIKREMKKTGKNMIASDFGAYYSLMEDTEGE